MKVLRLFAGMIVGAAIGAAVVLILTPQSGEETRQMIQDRVQTALDEGKEAAEARRLELTAQFEGLKQPKPSE
jgi:gas vesicle protein